MCDLAREVLLGHPAHGFIMFHLKQFGKYLESTSSPWIKQGSPNMYIKYEDFQETRNISVTYKHVNKYIFIRLGYKNLTI